MLLDVWLLHGMVMLLAVAWLGVKLFSCLQQTPKVRLPGSIPEKGQHFGAGNGACPLEEGLGVRCTVLPPGELHTKRIAVNHLKVSDPAAATMCHTIWRPSHAFHVTATVNTLSLSIATTNTD